VPAAVAIPAAISAGSSIIGGVLGSRAAKSAAQIQQEEAQRQAQGFRDVTAEYNPRIQATAEQARQDVLNAANTAGTNLTGVARDAAGNLVDVAERGATGITGAATEANQYLEPYLGVGTQAAKSMAEFMGPGGAGTKDFTYEDMKKFDPGYQFRLDQANRALAGSAAARGGALGGGALKAAMNLSQNMAASEYGAAFDRFRSQQNDRFSRFGNLMDMGVRTGALAGGNLMTAAQQAAAMRTGAAQTAGGWNIGANQTAGGWNVGAAEYGGNAMQNAMAQQSANAFNSQRSIADLMTSGAAAQAAGKIGSANAWSGMLGGIAGAANQVGGYYQQKQLLNDYMTPGGFTPYAAASKTYYPQPSTYMPNPGMPAYRGPGYGDLYGAGSIAPPPRPPYIY
jgi:hypothetical protein